jgi:hypothetical protein
MTILSSAQAQYGGGTGEPNDPYQIATAADLILLGETPEDYDKHFILTADIDLSDLHFGRAVIAADTNDVDDSYPYQGTLFSGHFDGQGHGIHQLHIEGKDHLGLFGKLAAGAQITNLSLVNANVVGTESNIGLLAGYNHGRVSNCYSTGTITGEEHHVGGLVGFNHGSITTSYSTGSVSGRADAGGLVGRNPGSITTSYSTGSVSGDFRVGGLVGWNRGSITMSYSTGVVTGNNDVGGLVGEHNGRGSITLSFWNIETSGQPTSAGGTGLTTPEMQDINTYLSEGWDFVDEILNGTCDYWQISPGDYPRLHYHAGESPVMPEGLGTAEQPYLIRDARDLGTVWFKPMAHYRMETSLDLSGTTWSMAVVPWFDGTFEGNGHMISNLHIQGSRYLGLFGQLDSRANISNLGLEAVDVKGTGECVGGLAGSIGYWYSEGGIVANCYSSGTVAGEWSVGGLVGSNNTGSIATSYSTGTVSGNYYVGGLVGDNNIGSITSSYSTGTVSGNDSVGGLVGIGGVGVVHSVWDMESSGLSGSAGGAGLTTVEMMDPYMLGLNGFANDPNWVLDAGRDYPRLAWEGTAGQIIPEPIIDWLDGQGTEQEPYRVRRTGN